MKIFKYLLCLLLLVVAPQIGYCQIGKAVKQASKIFMKKGAKEGADAAAKGASKAVAKKTTKELAGEAAELSIKKNVRKSLTYDVMDAASRQDIFQLEQLGAEKLLRRKLSKEIAEKASRSVIRQGDVVIAVPVENQLFRKMGTRESRQILEKSTRQELRVHGEKSAAKKAGIRAGKTFKGIEALNKLDDMPALKQLVSGFEKKLGPNFALDNLVVRRAGKETIVEFAGTKSVVRIKNGVIAAKSGSIVRKTPAGNVVEGELNQFLNNPLPNTQYVVDDFIKYETNHLGQTIGLEVNTSKLFQKMQREGLSHGDIHGETRNELLKRFGDFDSNSIDYGHLFRRELGGPNEAINALPMKKEMQRSKSKWYKFEQKEVDACKSGKDVKMKMRIDYSPDGKYSVFVEKQIDGKTYRQVFTDLL